MKLENNLKAKYIECKGESKSLEQVLHERRLATEKIRIDINFEKDPFRMLDLALLCIYTMTGDWAFYQQNREKVINYICNWSENKEK